jgi:peptide/nickel transport system substrate-binding protein
MPGIDRSTMTSPRLLMRETRTTRRGFTRGTLVGAAALGGLSGGLSFTPGRAAPGARLAQDVAPVRGGTLNAMVQNDWVSLDPLFNSAEPNGTSMIYGHWVLLKPDPDTGVWGPVPDMIAEWDLGDDLVTLTLQEGITFHDGTPWNAEAAKWNMDRMIFHPNSTMKSYLGAVDTSGEDMAAIEALPTDAESGFDYVSQAVEIIDDMTIGIKLTQASAPFMAVLSNAVQWNNPISPTAYNEAGRDAFSRNPVGSGPFRFVEWQPGNQLVIERNPDYWREGADGEPEPYLDQIVYRLVVDDSVRLLELRSGNTDFTELIQGKDVADVEADPGVTLVQSESQGNNYRMIFDSTNEDSVFVKHKELRQAVLYGLDRDAMAQVLGFGAGFGRRFLLPVGSLGYDESLPSYWYDQAQATQLVQDVIAADASVANAEGRIPVTLTVIDRALDTAQAEMIKQMLDAIGFEVTIEILERAAWTAKLVRTPGQEGGSFEFATMRNPVPASDPDLEWRTFYYSTGGFNVAHLADPDLDAKIDAAASIYDPEERTALYHELAQQAFDDPWYGFLWQQNWNWAMNSRVTNFSEPVTNRWLFNDVWLAEG